MHTEFGPKLSLLILFQSLFSLISQRIVDDVSSVIGWPAPYKTPAQEARF